MCAKIGGLVHNCSNGDTKISFTYTTFFLKFCQPLLNPYAKNGSPQKVFVHVDKPLTPPHMDKHGFFGNPPPPSPVHMVYGCRLNVNCL